MVAPLLSQLILFQSGVQIMPTTLILAPRIFRPSYGFAQGTGYIPLRRQFAFFPALLYVIRICNEIL